jgi:hypothetical protein
MPCFGVDLRVDKPNIDRILRGGALAGADAKLFDDYFKEFFRQFLNPAAGPTTFYDARKALTNFLRTGKTGPAYTQLRTMATKGLRIVAGDKRFSSAARVNAALILGSFNDREPDGKPLASELPVLIYMVKGDPKDAARFPDETKIAAMIGLERYAREGAILPKEQPAVAALMLGILEQDSPPGNRTLEGHTWMRLSAAQVLAALGNPGKDNNIVNAFEKVIADSGQRASFRCEMAECLGKLQITKESNVDYQTLANLLGHQAVEICKGEIEAAKSSGRPVSRGMIVYALASTMHGLKGQSGRAGLAAAAPDASAQTTIDTLYKAVEALVTELQGSLQPKPQPKQDVVAAADGAAPPPAPPAAAN